MLLSELRWTPNSKRAIRTLRVRMKISISFKDNLHVPFRNRLPTIKVIPMTTKNRFQMKRLHQMPSSCGSNFFLKPRKTKHSLFSLCMTTNSRITTAHSKLFSSKCRNSIRSKTKMPISHMNQILSCLHRHNIRVANSKGEKVKVPRNYDALFKELGMASELGDFNVEYMCVNHCVLFAGDLSDTKVCPKCNTLRSEQDTPFYFRRSLKSNHLIINIV